MTATLDGGLDASTPDAATDADAALGDTGTTATTYRQAVLNDKPLAYWSFGTSIGASVDDLSGHGHVLTMAGTPTIVQGTSQATAHAMHLSGGQSYGSSNVPDFFGRSPFTLEAWAQADQIDGAYRHVFGDDFYPDAAGRYMIGVFVHDSGSKPELSFERISNGSSTTIFTQATTKFVHIVATYDGDSLSLYVDGALVETKPDTLSQIVKDGPMIVGARSTSSNIDTGFIGAIAEVALYETALSVQQIKLHHDLGVLPL